MEKESQHFLDLNGGSGNAEYFCYDKFNKWMGKEIGMQLCGKKVTFGENISLALPRRRWELMSIMMALLSEHSAGTCQRFTFPYFSIPVFLLLESSIPSMAFQSARTELLLPFHGKCHLIITGKKVDVVRSWFISSTKVGKGKALPRALDILIMMGGESGLVCLYWLHFCTSPLCLWLPPSLTLA